MSRFSRTVRPFWSLPVLSLRINRRHTGCSAMYLLQPLRHISYKTEEEIIEITDHGRREPPNFKGLADERPTDKNVKILQNAAEAGDPEAQYLWGKNLRYPPEGPPDFRSSFAYFLKSGKNGYPDSFLQIGISYLFGLGVKEDHHEAKHWFQKANRALGGERNIARWYLDCLEEKDRREMT